MARLMVPVSTRTMYGTFRPVLVVAVARSAGRAFSSGSGTYVPAVVRYM